MNWLDPRPAVAPGGIAPRKPAARDRTLVLFDNGKLSPPFHDLAPDDLHFEAVNALAVRGIWQPDADSLDFQPWKPVTRRELARSLVRLQRTLADAKEFPASVEPRFRDVPAADSDRQAIEAMMTWGEFGPPQPTFNPDTPVDWGTLHRWLTALKLPANPGLARQKDLPLTRAELATHLWAILKTQREWLPDLANYLKPGNDLNGNGIPDLEDPLPLPKRF